MDAVGAPPELELNRPSRLLKGNTMEFRFGDQTGSLTDDTYAHEDFDGSPDGEEISVKRVFDIVAASLGLLFLAPMLFVVGVLIRLQDGEKALYSQPRWGLNGETFH